MGTRRYLRVLLGLCALGASVAWMAPRASAQDEPAGSEEAPAEAAPAEAAPETPAPEVAPDAPASDPEAQEAAPVASAALVEARERVGRGETLFEQGNYDAALVEFIAAHDLLDGHPMQYFVLYNVGQCYEQLFRYGQAMQYYRRYLEEGGSEAEDAGEVRGKIGVLAGLLGTIHISVVSGEATAPLESWEVWVDERRVDEYSAGENTTEVLVPGGNHVVEIRAEGFVAARQEVQLPARDERELSFELEPLAEEHEGLSPALFWTSTALAVVTAAVGGAFGIMALNRRSDIDAELGGPDMGFGAVTDSDKDDVESLALTADVLYGVAALFGVTAVIFAFMTEWGEVTVGDDGDDQSARLRLRVAPAAAPDAAGLLLRGEF